jgi:hypothetical protein
MMTDESIEARIIGGLAKIKKTKPENIQKQARLIEDLGIDSLDTLDLIFLSWRKNSTLRSLRKISCRFPRCKT